MGTCQFSTCVDAKDIENERINIAHGSIQCTDVNGNEYTINLSRRNFKGPKIKSPDRRGRPRKNSRSP